MPQPGRQIVGDGNGIIEVFFVACQVIQLKAERKREMDDSLSIHQVIQSPSRRISFVFSSASHNDRKPGVAEDK